MLRVCLLFIVCFRCGLVGVAGESTERPVHAGIMDPAVICAVMEVVADESIPRQAKEPDRVLTNWVHGVCAAGYMALAEVSVDGKYEATLRAMADRLEWRLGSRNFSADDQVIAQTYLDLLQRKPNAERLTWIRGQLDAGREASTDASWGWCDALFMAPPVWVRLAAMAGDSSYLLFMDRLWTVACDKLYDPEERLFYRGTTYKSMTEANGRKLFWGRGNGWVLAGLARVLGDLPRDHPTRPTYVNVFTAMAGKIASLQQPDGMWRASLLDPGSFPMPEASSTGLFIAGLAAGVNQGILDRATYLPVITRAWAGLVTCVDARGRLGFVQPVGHKPDQHKPSDTQYYGVGAFLLAGRQVYSLAGGVVPPR